MRDIEALFFVGRKLFLNGERIVCQSEEVARASRFID